MRLPRRTVRLKLTALYGALFLLSGALLLLISGAIDESSGTAMAVRAPFGQDVRPPSVSPPSAVSPGTAPGSHQLLVSSLIALGIMTAAWIVLGWVAAGRVLRPLRVMTAATRRISADSLHERLAMPGPGDELKDLADTIDGLLGRIEGAFAAQKRFVANAAHELRTPLATMRASVDVAEAKPGPVPAQTAVLAGRLRTELDRVDRLLDGFLVLARAQHGAMPGRDVLALGELASAALAARAWAIKARNLAVRVAGGDRPHVLGDTTLLSRMVDNVIDNAIAHNCARGWITVATVTHGATAWLVVETGGEVLDQRQVAELAQPFRRLAADRTGSDQGSGLGLSIVAAIAEAHGGTLLLQARPEGGLRVSIGLPLASFSAVGVRAGAVAGSAVAVPG
jgi:signal transduction histidine kinase